MANNPLYNTNDSPNNSTQPTKSVNRQGVYVPRTHNTFDNSYFHFKTQRFGQYEPFFVMEGVPKDLIPLHSSHQVRSLPMATPFLSELKLNKDYFMIPNQAIQPNTWEYCYDLPSQGDDVPEDAHNIFPLFDTATRGSQVLRFMINSMRNVYNEDTTKFLWLMLSLETLLSQGSLLYNLGYKLNPIFKFGDDILSFDDVFERMASFIDEFSIIIESDNFSGEFSISTGTDLYTMFSLMRRYGSSVKVDSFSVSFEDLESFLITGLPVTDEVTPTGSLRMDRICAYQLACAQYYVNPQIDFIYNAQLYRDNFIGILRDLYHDYTGQDMPIRFFNRNGISVPYDYFSLCYYDEFAQIVKEVCTHPGEYDISVFSKVYDIFHYLFGFRESLRFGDYFTDCRTRPLAIGDNNVEVTGDGVDVIDMSRKVIYQRFRNAVIKLGNNFGDYLRGIFGSEPSPDYHIPKFIAHQDFKIGGMEVANTTGNTASLNSNGQGSLVTNLKTADDTFSFEVTCDMPCILIGISYFSVPRIYCQTKERQFFHRDRYDMFNPMLQYIGDQPVYNNERTNLRPSDETFGYQSRNGEYKQRVSVASGGFVQYLPAWSFITDSIFNPITDITLSNVQSPDFIRAHDYEFNRFFKAYPGVSLAKGFHFIVVYNNKCMSSRPMEINPSTL